MPKVSGVGVVTDVVKSASKVEIKKEGETAHSVIWTPGEGKRFILQEFVVFLFTTAATVATFEDGTEEICKVLVPKIATEPANTGGFVALRFPIGYESKAQGNKLQWKLVATQTEVSWLAFGTEAA